MAKFESINYYTFSNKHGYDSFMGYLRGTSGWNLSEASDRLHGRLEPELDGTKFEMEWKLETSSSSLIKIKFDGTQLNGRTKKSDAVWEKLDALYMRSK